MSRFIVELGKDLERKDSAQVGRSEFNMAQGIRLARAETAAMVSTVASRLQDVETEQLEQRRTLNRIEGKMDALIAAMQASGHVPATQSPP